MTPPPLDTAAAAAAMANGGVLILPTDTICGFHARSDCVPALARIAELKGRPSEQPLLVLAASLEQALALCRPLDARQAMYCQAAWPGPFTFILPASPDLAPAVRDAARGTVAVRVPARPDLCRLIRLAGAPLASTSVNRSGAAPLGRLEQAVAAFGPLCDGWWAGEDPTGEGGAVPGGQASALVDLTREPPRVLRPGPRPLPWPGPRDS